MSQKPLSSIENKPNYDFAKQVCQASSGNLPIPTTFNDGEFTFPGFSPAFCIGPVSTSQ